MTRTSMSAPEMPAKEVSPEFGFREASPSVAAAALAAIKTGGPGNGRRTRGGTGRRPAAPAELPPGENVVAEKVSGDGAAAATAEAGEEVRRRRRRRGGRGRGRSRRDEETTAPAVSGDEEIGWQEFDDLAQLDGGADVDREFTFEEADAATLAELGIEPSSAVVEETAAEEKPKRRSRAKAAAPSDEAASDEKPKRTRSTKTTGTEPTAAAEKPKRSRSTKASTADAAADEKPKRRSRAKAADQPDASVSPSEGTDVSDGEPQGIWGRFRSGRKTPSTN